MSQSELEQWVKKNKRKNNIRFWLRFLPGMLFTVLFVHILGDAVKEGVESLSEEGILLACIGVGALMIWCAIDQGFLQRIRCSEVIRAEYTGIWSLRHGGKLCFSYHWKDVPYASHASGYAFEFWIKKKYVKGLQYEIFINPDNPREIRANSKIGRSNIFLLFMGVVMVGLPIYLMFL